MHVVVSIDEPPPPFLQTHTGPPTFTVKSAHAQNEKFCSRKEGGGSPSYEMSAGDGVGGATLFSVEKFATHEPIDKYTQEYNSLVFHITLCLN